MNRSIDILVVFWPNDIVRSLRLVFQEGDKRLGISKRRAEKRSAFRHLWLRIHRVCPPGLHLLLQTLHEHVYSAASKMSIQCRNAGLSPQPRSGGNIFFTVNLANRRSDLLVREIETLRAAIRAVRVATPFHIDAWVILPDHMHCI